MQWFYYENHEPKLQPFVVQLPEFDGSWTEELTGAEMPMVQALAEKVSKLEQHGLIGVSVVTNFLAHQVTPLKKQVHPGWEYSGIQDPTCEINRHITTAKLEQLLKEIF
jgi:hypothetical protein